MICNNAVTKWTKARSIGLAALALSTTALTALPALAQTNAEVSGQIQQLQDQVRGLQQQLDTVKSSQQGGPRIKGDVESTDFPAQPAKTPNTRVGNNTLTLGSGIRLTLGGFIEAASIWRSRNETADVGSNFNTGIPFANSPNYHNGEFRGSARQSRVAGLVEGDVDKYTTLSAYIETDFLGAAGTANSNESNSYNLRLRHAYATIDNTNWGFHFLGGQSWSLVTLNRVGITPRQEDIPLTIDAQYVVGFNWTRQWQLRFVKDWDRKYWLGLSIESPQSTIGGNSPGNTFATNPGVGGGLLNPNVQYSLNQYPDIVLKAAADPGFGHYEVFGLARFFHDQSTPAAAGGSAAHDAVGGGIGAGLILPVVPKVLDFQLSGLYGSGIGRYGSGQMPDVTYSGGGGLTPLRELEVMTGLIGHPNEAWDIYGYAGLEKVEKNYGVNGATLFGYGNPGYINSGCDISFSALACVGNTSAVAQETVGAWYRIYKGSFGTVALGIQQSYTRRYAFAGIGGSPVTDENIFMTSFRYYPF